MTQWKLVSEKTGKPIQIGPAAVVGARFVRD